MQIKTLVVFVLMFSASSALAQGLVKHDDGVVHEVIAKCLSDNFGMIEGEHFRRNPKNPNIVQLNRAKVLGDIIQPGVTSYEDINECWKKEPNIKAPHQAATKAVPKQ